MRWAKTNSLGDIKSLSKRWRLQDDQLAQREKVCCNPVHENSLRVSEVVRMAGNGGNNMIIPQEMMQRLEGAQRVARETSFSIVAGFASFLPNRTSNEMREM